MMIDERWHFIPEYCGRIGLVFFVPKLFFVFLKYLVLIYLSRRLHFLDIILLLCFYRPNIDKTAISLVFRCVFTFPRWQLIYLLLLFLLMLLLLLQLLFLLPTSKKPSTKEAIVLDPLQ